MIAFAILDTVSDGYPLEQIDGAVDFFAVPRRETTDAEMGVALMSEEFDEMNLVIIVDFVFHVVAQSKDESDGKRGQSTA